MNKTEVKFTHGGKRVGAGRPRKYVQEKIENLEGGRVRRLNTRGRCICCDRMKYTAVGLGAILSVTSTWIRNHTRFELDAPIMPHHEALRHGSTEDAHGVTPYLYDLSEVDDWLLANPKKLKNVPKHWRVAPLHPTDYEDFKGRAFVVYPESVR